MVSTEYWTPISPRDCGTLYNQEHRWNSTHFSLPFCGDNTRHQLTAQGVAVITVSLLATVSCGMLMENSATIHEISPRSHNHTLSLILTSSKKNRCAVVDNPFHVSGDDSFTLSIITGTIFRFLEHEFPSLALSELLLICVLTSRKPDLLSLGQVATIPGCKYVKTDVLWVAWNVQQTAG